MTEELEDFEGFSLLGGPLHRLGSRLGLVREGTNTLRLGFALGLAAWVVLVALAVLQGVTRPLFSLPAVGTHARLLVAIPLFFLCESWMEPQWKAFVSMVVRSGVVPNRELAALKSAIARTTRLKNSWLAEGLCLLLAVLIPSLATQVGLVDTAAARTSSETGTQGALVGWWFLMVCLPLFRFLMLRWLWRLGLWWYFLWRLERLDLHLRPTHPDGAAGLGYLETVHSQFTPLILAFSVVQAAMVANGIAEGVMVLESLFPSLAWVLLLDAVLFLGPLFLFMPKLWTCRTKGLRDYGVFAARYVTAFDKKWLDPQATPPDEPLLGTGDIQSLADLSGSVDIVRIMRLAPVSLRLFGAFAAAALLPVLPLFLIQYPAGELVKRLLTSLVGL